MSVLYTILGIVVVLVIWGVFAYNSLVQQKNWVKEAWAQIDVQLQRRNDLIPNLVETVKGYAKHEQETLSQVIAMRNQIAGMGNDVSPQEKMDASNGIGENSIGLFGSSGSKLVNSPTGEIQLGTRGVGIWGANKIDSSPVSWSKNIEITNNGKITGLSGKEGVFGIYAVNDTTNYSTAASNITHGTTGNIDLSQSKKSIGIYMTNGTLTSLGNMFVNICC